MSKIIIIGGRGNGSVIAAAIEDIFELQRGVRSPKWVRGGFLNDAMEIGEKLNGWDVLGKVDDAPMFNISTTFFVYALFGAKKALLRLERLRQLGIPDHKFATLRHPTAVVEYGCTLGHGVVLMPGVVLSPDVVIGNHTHVYAHGFVGHNSHIGDYSMITNNVSIGSMIEAEEGVHFGSNCTVLERVKIGKWAVIGGGAVVLPNQVIEPYSVMVGNPAKKVGEVEHDN